MKAHSTPIKLMFLISIYITLQTVCLGQVLHPWPRMACPICNARVFKEAFSAATQGIALSALSREEKIKLISKYNPNVDPGEVVKVIDNMTSLDLRHIHIEKDQSFSTYIIEFGDGKNKPFYTIRSTSNSWKHTGNSSKSVLDKVAEISNSEESVYLLMDDMYSEQSQKFMSNIKTYNSTKVTSKIKGLPSDIYLAGKTTTRWGASFLKPGAKLASTSDIKSTIIQGVKLYTAEVGFIVQGMNVFIEIYGRTKEAVSKFIFTLKSLFITSPNTSIVRAINKSRQLSKYNVSVYYKEAGETQLVKLYSPSKLRALQFSPLYFIKHLHQSAILTSKRINNLTNSIRFGA